MKHIKTQLSFLLLLAVTAGFGQQTISNEVTDQWLQSASSHIKEMEYSFHSRENAPGLFAALNKANRLSFSGIQASGYTVQPAGNNNPDGWQASFQLRKINGDDVFTENAAPFTTIASGEHLTFRSPSLEVQYINDEKGMRQNFVVNQRPADNKTLSIDIYIATRLSLTLRQKGKLMLCEAGKTGTVRMIYDGLKVFDANGKVLNASMHLNEATKMLTIEADDANAVYPVTVDPLNRTAEWTTSADGVLPALLNNLQLQVQTLYGYTVAGLGDVNGDGYDDVAVSAPTMADVITGTGTLTGVGAVFIYLGSPTGLSTTPAKVLQPTTAVDGALFGYSIDAGDITGDGKNDIVIGAPMDRYQTQASGLLFPANVEVTAGKVYMYRSEDLFSAPNPTPFLEIKLQGTTYFCSVLTGLLHSNVTAKPLFGSALSVSKDLNGDNKADIIIGAPAYLGVDILSVQNGATFIYYSNNLSTVSPVQLNTPTPTLLGLPLLQLANTEGLLFGYSVDGAGDYNNDGNPDVVVGAPAGIDLSSLGGIFSGQFLGGSAYVYFGTGTGVNVSSTVRLQADVTGLLSNAANLFGYKVKGATNALGQKTGNIIVGAPDGAVLSNVVGGLRLKAGQVHVFKKTSGASGSYTSDQVISSPRSSSLLSILSGQTIQVSALFGASLDNMMDVNCDNIGDIIVGEPLSTAVPVIGADVVGGAAYVYLGNSDGTYQAAPMWDLYTNVSPLLGVNATSLIGYSVAGAGHVKGNTQGVRSLVGGPANALDFGAGLLNLGNTLGVLMDFTFDNNGLGKSYTYPYTTCNVPLPVKLISFTGKKSGNTVLLNWVADNEENMDAYQLQRSRDGIHFETIATIQSANRLHSTYSHTDINPATGMNYYRLRMTDNDNSFSYSNIVAVNFAGSDLKNIMVAPNPATENINIRFTGIENGVYRVELRNTTGQLIVNRSVTIWQQAGQVETIQRTAGMSSGIYSIYVFDAADKKVGTYKFLLTSQ